MAEGGRNVEEDDVAEWLRRQPRKLFRETGREFKSHRRRGSFFFFLLAPSPALSVAGCLCLLNGHKLEQSYATALRRNGATAPHDGVCAFVCGGAMK